MLDLGRCQRLRERVGQHVDSCDGTHCRAWVARKDLPSGRRRALGEICSVGAASSAHGNVEHCAGGAFAQYGVSGISGGALSGVDSDGVTVGDVVAEVVTGEDGAGVIGKSAGGDALVVRVDGVDTPTVSIAHQVRVLGPFGGVQDTDRGVVAAADDQVADSDLMSAWSGHGWRVWVDSLVVDALVQGRLSLPAAMSRR